jgi:hypothetical protein
VCARRCRLTKFPANVRVPVNVLVTATEKRLPENREPFRKGINPMNVLRINYVAVIVATLAAFVGSSLWYVVFGKKLAKSSPVFAEILAQRTAPWRILAVFAGTLVLSFVVAYVIGLKEGVTWTGAVGIGCLLWLGLSAVQWASSMVWEKVPLTMAAIHAGDWLMKLVVISAIVGVWRK